MTALMSMISSRYTGMVLIRSLNLLINIVFTVWRISLITFKHVNNIVDNGRREVDILLPININQYISIIASILKPSVPSRLLYDEDIKVMIVTSPNSRLDFLVKMDEALFDRLRISSLTTAPERGSPSTRVMFFLPCHTQPVSSTPLGDTEKR